MKNSINIKRITSAKNPVVIELAKLKHKKYRDKKEIFVIEGKKLFEEIFRVREKWDIENIIVSEDNIEFLENYEKFATFMLQKEKIRNSENFVISLNNTLFQKITDEKAPQGIICIVKKSENKGKIEYGLPVIILDNVRDPGNLGTIIRSMNAISRYNLILTGNCVDIYSSKVIRASMGAFFYQSERITITKDKDINNITEDLKSKGYKIYATHLSNNAKSIEDVSFEPEKTAVIFGNEGSGLSHKILDLCDENIIIPIQPNAESLNVSVAVTIFLWILK